MHREWGCGEPGTVRCAAGIALLACACLALAWLVSDSGHATVWQRALPSAVTAKNRTDAHAQLEQVINETLQLEAEIDQLRTALQRQHQEDRHKVAVAEANLNAAAALAAKCLQENHKLQAQATAMRAQLSNSTLSQDVLRKQLNASQERAEQLTQQLDAAQQEAQSSQLLPCENAPSDSQRHEAGSPVSSIGSLIPHFSHHILLRDACNPEQLPEYGQARHWLHGQSWWRWDGQGWVPGASGGAALPGTALAQQVIYRHQHPDSCSDAKFLVHTTSGYGLGSQLHVLGAGLATAMRLGRVYLHAFSDRIQYTTGPFCERDAALDECFFEPWSACSLADAGVPNHAAVDNLPKYGAPDTEKAIAIPGIEYWDDRREVPPQLLPALEAMGTVRPERYVAWWRAQAAAYMVRVNERTLQKLKDVRTDIFPGQEIVEGTIAVHVRHGDKASEAPLTPDSVYWEKVQAVQAADPRLRRAIFLQTYDPGTVAYFQNVTAAAGWGLQFTDIPRLDDDPEMSTIRYADEVGPTTEALNALVNLDLALSCSAFVATLSSNWGRLIDELRSTVGCAANRVYLDAGQDDPPANLGNP